MSERSVSAKPASAQWDSPEQAAAGKVCTIAQAASRVAELKAAGKRVVMCHGVFDLVHPGHLRHLRAAAAMGDALVVSITADKFVDKGPGRPAFNETLRADFLASFEIIAMVLVNSATTAVNVIRAIRPDVYVKGSDYRERGKDPTGNIFDEEQAIHAVGGRIAFTDEMTFSSSNLLNTYFDVFSRETEEWLRGFRAKYTAEQVIGYLDKIRGTKVLVVGEPIIDEYVFCRGLGKSSKDPILAMQYRSIESHAGGSLAVANHLAELTGAVGLVGQLGDSERREDFVRASLAANVQATFTTRNNSPTIHKRRFVDEHTGMRMFELYLMEDTDPADTAIAELNASLERCLPDYDVVIAIDYGHGMIGSSTVGLLCDRAKFLAVNTQANAGNRGFNTISKYPRADYVCLAGHEVELETRLRHAPFEELANAVAARIDCAKFTVTRGKTGSLHFERGGPHVHVPAFASVVVDRVGAGDAVLAVTAPLVAIGAPWDIVGFIGNICGGQMVAQLGNRAMLKRSSIVKAITALLK